MEIVVRDDFRDLIPPLSEAELEQLHRSLDAKGRAVDALVVWKDKNILLDGHNRKAYCDAKGYRYEVRYEYIVDDNEARNWIILNQLGRRNLAPKAASHLRGKLYNGAKKEVPNQQGVNQHSEVRGQNDPQPKTAAAVAAQTGVSEKTVKRDGKFAESVEELGIEKEVMSGENKQSKEEIIAEAKAKKNGQAKPKPKPRRESWEVVVEKFSKLPFDRMKKAIEGIERIWNAQ